MPVCLFLRLSYSASIISCVASEEATATDVFREGLDALTNICDHVLATFDAEEQNYLSLQLGEEDEDATMSPAAAASRTKSKKR